MWFAHLGSACADDASSSSSSSGAKIDSAAQMTVPAARAVLRILDSIAIASDATARCWALALKLLHHYATPGVILRAASEAAAEDKPAAAAAAAAVTARARSGSLSGPPGAGVLPAFTMPAQPPLPAPPSSTTRAASASSSSSASAAAAALAAGAGNRARARAAAAAAAARDGDASSDDAAASVAGVQKAVSAGLHADGPFVTLLETDLVAFVESLLASAASGVASSGGDAGRLDHSRATRIALQRAVLATLAASLQGVGLAAAAGAAGSAGNGGNSKKKKGKNDASLSDAGPATPAARLFLRLLKSLRVSVAAAAKDGKGSSAATAAAVASTLDVGMLASMLATAGSAVRNAGTAGLSAGHAAVLCEVVQLAKLVVPHRDKGKAGQDQKPPRKYQYLGSVPHSHLMPLFVRL